MKPIRTVFDTNVYLAATKSDSYAQMYLRRSEPTGSFALYISPDIIIEIRAKLETRFLYSPEESAGFIKMIMRYAQMVYPERRLSGIVKDDDDHRILECALAANAHLIISSDKELIRLKEFEGIRIAHPSMLKYWFPD